MVASLIVVAGCGSSGSEPAAPNPRDPVRVMLRERARLLSAGDVEGWLRPVAPEARPPEEQLALGARSVPLARIDLTLGSADIDQQGTRLKNASVVLVYRYKGLPADNVFRYHLSYDMELRDGAWVVTRSAPDHVGHSQPPVWSTGPVEVAESPHFLALFRGLGNAADMLAKAETGRAQLLPRLTLEPDDRHLAVLARDAEEFTDFSGEPGATAVATVVFRAPTGAELARPENRLLIADVKALTDADQIPQSHEGRPDLFPVEVFQHELGHLALSRFSRSSTPVWVREGGAMYLASERRSDDWKAILGQDLFEPEDLSLGLMSGLEGLTDPQYAYANAAVSYLVEAFGVERFWDFYQNFKEFVSQDIPEIRSSGAQRLARRYYDFDLDELDLRTRDWMRQAVAAGD